MSLIMMSIRGVEVKIKCVERKKAKQWVGSNIEIMMVVVVAVVV